MQENNNGNSKKGGLLIRLFPKGQVWTIGGENANPDNTARKAFALALSEGIIKIETLRQILLNWDRAIEEDKAWQIQKPKRLL